MKKLLVILLSGYLSACTLELNPTLTEQQLNERIKGDIEQNQRAFDWADADDEMLCSAHEQSDGIVTVGSEEGPLDANMPAQLATLSANIEAITGADSIIGSSDTLGCLKVRVQSCEDLLAIRELPAVGFVEPSFALDAQTFGQVPSVEVTPETSSGARIAAQEQTQEATLTTPGTYNPDANAVPYDQYLTPLSPQTADRIRRHNLDEVYNRYQYFGSPEVGVAVLDNGVLPRDLDYLSTGSGGYEALGFYRPFGLNLPFYDGPHPQFYDFFGISILIPVVFNHGSSQSRNVFDIVPQAHRKTVRATSFLFLLLPTQFEGVAESIVAMADDPEIKVASMSMGTLLFSNEIARAIEYFNSKDKIFVTSAGTFAPVLKELFQVAFPANLPTTISTTGINAASTPDNFILGNESLGGPENDFVLDSSDSSSSASSTTAGMIALLWSVNPEMTREEVLDIMIQSSNFYQSQGEKHPVFGWGKVDMLQAVETARATIVQQ